VVKVVKVIRSLTNTSVIKAGMLLSHSQLLWKFMQPTLREKVNLYLIVGILVSFVRVNILVMNVINIKNWLNVNSDR